MQLGLGPTNSCRVFLFIQLHFVENKLRPKRVQISRCVCTPEDRLDRFSHNAEATNWIEVTKKMADDVDNVSDDEESEWLENSDLRLFDK